MQGGRETEGGKESLLRRGRGQCISTLATTSKVRSAFGHVLPRRRVSTPNYLLITVLSQIHGLTSKIELPGYSHLCLALQRHQYCERNPTTFSRIPSFEDTQASTHFFIRVSALATREYFIPQHVVRNRYVSSVGKAPVAGILMISYRGRGRRGERLGCLVHHYASS